MTEFLIGLLVGVVLTMLIVFTSYDTVEFQERRLNEAYRVCEIANSEPVSFNLRSVTCKNGAKMSLDVLKGDE